MALLEYLEFLSYWKYRVLLKRNAIFQPLHFVFPPPWEVHTVQSFLVWVKKWIKSVISPRNYPRKTLWALICSSVLLSQSCVLHTLWVFFGVNKIFYEMISTTQEPFNKYQFPSSDFFTVYLNCLYSLPLKEPELFSKVWFCIIERSFFLLLGMFNHLSR